MIAVALCAALVVLAEAAAHALSARPARRYLFLPPASPPRPLRFLALATLALSGCALAWQYAPVTVDVPAAVCRPDAGPDPSPQSEEP